MELWTVSVNADPRYSVYGAHGGGQGKFVRTIATDMVNLGWNVTTITSSSGAADSVQHHDDIPNLIDLENPSTPHISDREIRYSDSLFQKLDKLIESKPPPAAILCCHALSWPLVSHIHKRTAAPIISSLCSSGREKEEGLGKVDVARRRFENELINKSEILIASSESESTILKQDYQAPVDKIIEIPRPIDVEKFSPSSSMSPPFSVLFVGRPTRQKGLDTFLEAIAHINECDVPVTIVGCSIKDINEDSILCRYMKNIDIAKITIIPSIDHIKMPSVIRAHSVVVIPSRYETYGNIAVEAMACGIPIIATNVGALRTHINNSKAGYLVEPDSPQDLAHAITKLRSRPNEQKRMGSLGRAYAQKADKRMIIQSLSQAINHKLELFR